MSPPPGKRLLLASKSTARRRMLDGAGVPYLLAEARFDEDAAKADLQSRGLAPAALARALAQGKALAVAADPGELVFGSDQTLEREDGSMLDKARSRQELAEQLRSLRGRQHRLHSAAVLVQAGQILWEAVETVALQMRDFSDLFLQDYLDREFDEVRWSVGGYHIEGRGAQLFERIDGSHFAVLGLPLLPLLAFLREQKTLLS